jgi:hypothetical protein
VGRTKAEAAGLARDKACLNASAAMPDQGWCGGGAEGGTWTKIRPKLLGSG